MPARSRTHASEPFAVVRIDRPMKRGRGRDFAFALVKNQVMPGTGLPDTAFRHPLIIALNAPTTSTWFVDHNLMIMGDMMPARDPMVMRTKRRRKTRATRKRATNRRSSEPTNSPRLGHEGKQHRSVAAVRCQYQHSLARDGHGTHRVYRLSRRAALCQGRRSLGARQLHAYRRRRHHARNRELDVIGMDRRRRRRMVVCRQLVAFAEYNYLDFGTPGVTFTPAVRRFLSTSSRTSTASWWASITASVRSPTDGSSDRRRDRIDRAVARSPRVTRGSLFEARGVPTSTLRCGQREQPTHCITVFFSRFIYVRRESALSRPQPGRAVVVRLRPSDSTAIAV